MNGPGDIPLTLGSTPEINACSLISIIPTLGMASCRGRAEAFARRLSSKLRTLGSQADDESISQEEVPIIVGNSTSNWLPPHESEQAVTDLQPLRHESDSFFDFDCELESPGSPVDECEYLRLIETASNTPHNSNSAPESGYVCASASSSHSSADGTYLDAANSETSASKRTKISALEQPNYVRSIKANGPIESLSNGFDDEHEHFEDNGIETTVTTAPEENHLVHHSAELKITQPDAGQAVATTADSEDKSTTQKMIEKQDEIIHDLQKQSEDYANAKEKAINGSDIASKEVGIMATEEIRGNETSTTVLTVMETVAAEIIVPPAELKSPNRTITADTMVMTQSVETSNILDLVILPRIDDSTTNGICNGHTKIDNEVHDLDIDENLGKDSELSTAATDNQIANTDKQTAIKASEKKEPNSRELSTLDTTDDEDDCRPQRVRRCSSLKTGKTPPGTPGRKKIVRFADVLGLDLADVKTFLDEIPTIPKSAFEDLEILESEPPLQLGPRSHKLLMPLFQQPGGLSTFLDQVREKQVSLENAAVTDSINQTITGTVRVRNLDFNKSVHVRYSLDGWRSFADLQANYVQNSCDGFSDKFTFIIFGNSLCIGQRLEFAVRFQCKGQQFWDNNYGANYCFQCLPTSHKATTPIQHIATSHPTIQMLSMLSPSVGETWCTSFY